MIKSDKESPVNSGLFCFKREFLFIFVITIIKLVQMKKIRIILLINNLLLLIIFSLKQIFEFYKISNSKIFALIVGIHLLINAIFIIKFTNKNLQGS